MPRPHREVSAIGVSGEFEMGFPNDRKAVGKVSRSYLLKIVVYLFEHQILLSNLQEGLIVILITNVTKFFQGIDVLLQLGSGHAPSTKGDPHRPHISTSFVNNLGNRECRRDGGRIEA